MNDPVLLYAASAALACVLLLGALEKLRDMAGFAAAVSAYRLLPEGWSRAFAWTYALAETAAGVLLLAPSSQPEGAALALLLLAAATAALAFNLL
ncbi:MauE/DoxX family redox-associated membrane protein, partial [Achromobacter denitrificans]